MATATGRARPEPNFGRFVAEAHQPEIVITAHALQRFVTRLQPQIPRAEHIADLMAPLEGLRSGTRTGLQQRQLAEYRSWMAANVEEHLRDLIRCEGFWATEPPRWARTRTPTAGHLQIGGLCYFPVALDNGIATLKSCINANGITWDVALDRGYTLMPKPLFESAPTPQRTPSWVTIIQRAWPARSQHNGPIAAYRAERAAAVEQTQRENAHRQHAYETRLSQWHTRRDHAIRTFRERHG